MRRIVVFLSLILLVITQHCVAEEKINIHLVYFRPIDKAYKKEIHMKFVKSVEEAKEFYASQMESYKFGRKTFTYDPAVQIIVGLHPDDYYKDDMQTKVLGETYDTYNTRDVYFIVFDTDHHGLGGGTGGRLKGSTKGYAIIPSRKVEDYLGFAHEAAHAFGLFHDFRDNRYILSYNYVFEKDKILPRAGAYFLSKHPCFNGGVYEGNVADAKITLIAPQTQITYNDQKWIAEEMWVLIRILIEDPDGLYQVQLFTRTVSGFNKAYGQPEIVDTKVVQGVEGVEIEFCFSPYPPSNKGMTMFKGDSAFIAVVDQKGNITYDGYRVLNIIEE